MRILVVEDEPELRYVISQTLRDDGYAVDEAQDGEEGQCKATSGNYDAIILDLMLPKIDGWRVLAQIRTLLKTPLLLVTARDAIADRVRGLDGGADDYLVKPFDLTELKARLRALIRRAAQLARPGIEIGNLVVDTIGKKIIRDGSEIAMTAREYAILEYLALRRGQVVSRTELYDHIFDENEDSLSNLLDVHVSNIRKKIGKDLIATRRGHGYIIDV